MKYIYNRSPFFRYFEKILKLKVDNPVSVDKHHLSLVVTAIEESRRGFLNRQIRDMYLLFWRKRSQQLAVRVD